jgi:RNA polymerase sigma factor (sigma-70 family)
MIEDAELLRRYADEKSEDAFAELVRRRIGLVYAVAWRHTRDAQRAEDVTQRVFTDLARKAAALKGRPVLVGWLYRSAQFAASDAVRSERRRQVREEEAIIMQQIAQEAAEPDWDNLRPVLDEVLNDMDERDRDAVLLRFFDGRPFAEIGERLRLTENTARMRVERALEKMRAALARRGATSTTAALAVAFGNQVGVAAPVGLAASVTSAAFAGAATSTLGLGLMAFMGKTTSTLVVAGLIAVGTGIAIYQARTNAALEREIGSLQSDKDRMIAQHRKELDAQMTMPAMSQVSRTEAEGNPAPPAAALVVVDSRPEPVSTMSNVEALAVAKEKFARAGNVWRTGLQDLDASSHAMRVWLKQDPAAVVRWLGTIDSEDKQREHTTEALILLEIDSDPGLALLLASSIAKDAPRMNRAREIVERWAVRDLEGAKHAIAAANFTEVERKRLLQMAEALA